MFLPNCQCVSILRDKEYVGYVDNMRPLPLELVDSQIHLGQCNISFAGEEDLANGQDNDKYNSSSSEDESDCVLDEMCILEDPLLADGESRKRRKIEALDHGAHEGPCLSQSVATSMGHQLARRQWQNMGKGR